jgi:hypothetical protein
MSYIEHFTILQLFGAICVLLFLFVLLRAHFGRGPIDLTDLITEWAAGKRRITMSRFTAFGGFLIGSWAFVSATVSNTLDTSWEGILAFMGICFGYRVSDSWLKTQRDAAAAEGQLNVEQTGKGGRK